MSFATRFLLVFSFVLVTVGCSNNTPVKENHKKMTFKQEVKETFASEEAKEFLSNIFTEDREEFNTYK